MIGRGVYAISLALVSSVSLACKDDPARVDAGTPTDATPHDDAGGPDAAPDDAGPRPPPPVVCPRENARPVTGDSNGDGVVDIADAVALLDHVFRGGRQPACEAAADFNGDGRVEADDATRIHSLLVTGTQGVRTLMQRACDDLTPWPAGRCAPVAWDLAAPTRTTEARFAVEVAVRSSTLALDGWSLSVTAAGCAVATATLTGTPSAQVWDQPPGLRRMGYAAVRAVDGGAIGYVLLSHHLDASLPAADRTPLMRLEVEAARPASGCASCTLSIDGERRWEGRPVAAVLASGGRSYTPAPASVTVEVCAP